ncbi:hypothetical protein CAI21_01095 [Alkalilimnicola ehrlichii]|uniref:HDOD domain-containing protein n=1 Tax=Alkalilimnicola ehrlichii TaxID=351052 RepID=A0A3E0X349_9GAMM|nr:HDOD domain-containing protein [Alkalilimnicola ehrlichii]RFA31266.1 hypothetical protein CAI21_01095 [Alkalilimnicola ehrlichii]RFA39458.1 hypothetical protein CAL65_01320 [Alkalilimnicola ehrlichii]
MTPEALVANAGGLVSLPRTYHRVSEMLDDPRFTAAEIGRVINHDPALTARVLKVVNSAPYRQPKKVENIATAIAVLGTRSLHDVLLATSVASVFSDINSQLVDVQDFWHHSIYCGILARLIGKRLGIANEGRLFTAGLLHDLGKLVIYRQQPLAASKILREVNLSRRPAYQVEQEILGFDHAAVGAALLKSWDLPEVYTEVVAHHHTPNLCADYCTEANIVHVANALSKLVEPGYKRWPPADSRLDLHPSVAEHVKLAAEEIAELQLEADVQSIDIFSNLFSGAAVPR